MLNSVNLLLRLLFVIHFLQGTMKKIILACTIFLLGNQLINAQLASGDIAFIGYNTDGSDNFSFITLANIPGNEVIYFTEEGWNNRTNSWAGTTEGHITYTAPVGGLSCGTIVMINKTPSKEFTVTGGGRATRSSGTGWSLSAGDQVLAYQASTPEPNTTPVFLAGVNGDDGNGTPLTLDPVTFWNSAKLTPLGTPKSEQPAGLTNGVDCVSLFPVIGDEEDNAKYTGSLTGTSTFIRGEINNYKNWTAHDGTAFSIAPSNYSASITCVAACTDADVPTVTANPSAICPGSSTTLTISGNLNDATNWHIYTGSCGGTQIKTTSGTTVTVSPSSNTTYFIRGEGGCVTPGSCGTKTVTVSDVTKPTITCPSNQTGSVDGSCKFTLPDYTSLATAGDNCSGVVVTQVPAAGTVVGIGTTNIVLTATDGSSNTANCNFDVVVKDAMKPTITCPGKQIETPNPNCQFTLPDYTGLATATDNCSGVVVTQTPVAGTVVGGGVTNVVLTATDASSNTVSCKFDVVVKDVTKPTITCPGNQTGTVDENCKFTLPDYTGLATAADNCSGVVFTQVPAAGTLVGIGTTNVVLTVTDGSSNTISCNFDVVVKDGTNPVIICPENQIGKVNENCKFKLLDYTGLAKAKDNCSGVVVTQVPAVGTVVGVGTTNIVLTATDGLSNTTTCNFDVVVKDVTKPTITCPGNQTGTVDENCKFTLPDYTGLATTADNCTGVVVTQVPAAGTLVGIGTTSVVLTGTDGSSNTISCNFDVVVKDATNPVIICPENQVGEVNENCKFTLLDYTGLATVTDNCSGIVVTQVPAVGTVVGIGTTNIVLTVTDGSSNTAACNFDVVVKDVTKPTITCPGNQTETPNANCKFTLLDYTGLAKANDNCSGVVVTQAPAVGTVITGTTTVSLIANR